MSRPRRDDGETLIEILVAVAVLSVGVVGLLTALGTQATTTVTNRSQSQASTVLLAAAEYVKNQPYLSCGASAVSVGPSQLPRESIFNVTYGPAVAAVAGTPCSELQAVPVRVTGDGFNMSLTVVKRS